jgi:hypothetical protein
MRLAMAMIALLSLVLPVPALAQASGEPEAQTTPAVEPAARPEVLYDPGLLPEPVRQMRERILEAALSGEPEKLRVAIQVNEMPPAFSFLEEGQADPIEALKKETGDGSGIELMAILAEVLEAGYVHVDKGTPQEMYVWPYFAQYPLDALTASQTLELYRIVTAYEVKEMREFGAYNFYRVGIAPDGVWHFFVAGD